MESKTNPVVIYELRENLPEPNKKMFRKSLLGGYNSKEVKEHIKFMDDRLKQAEASYINRLEEYNAETAMLSQERDKSKEQLSQVQAAMKDLEEKASLLSLENEELARKNRSLESRASKADAYLAQCDALRLEIDQLKKERADYFDSNQQLKAELTRSKENKEYSGDNEEAEENTNTPNDYVQIKRQCEEAINEKNNALEKYKTVSENLDAMYARNRELWSENSQLKLRIGKIISAYETNAHEIAHMHMKNTDSLRACINTVLDLLDSGSEDIIKLSREASAGLEPEDGIPHESDG